jgi:hypothetical protein
MLDKVKLFNEQQQRMAGGSRFFKSLGVPGFNAGGVVGGNTIWVRKTALKSI